jgi:hypothetical protein
MPCTCPHLLAGLAYTSLLLPAPITVTLINPILTKEHVIASEIRSFPLVVRRFVTRQGC